jgi:hypothetical protein
MKKTDKPGFLKTDEGSIINIDNNKLLAYKKAKQQNNKMKKMEQKIEILEQEVQTIKEYIIQSTIVNQ